MSIYKRGDVYWFHFRFDGQEVQKSTKQGNRQAAIKIEAAYRTKLALGEVGLDETPERRGLAIKDLLESLKTDYELRGRLSVQNANGIKRAEKDFGSIRVKNLTSTFVDEYKKRRLGDGAAPATINRVLQIIKKSYSLAVRRGDLKRTPYIQLLSEAGNTRLGFFEDHEFRKVHANLPADLKGFCLFGYLTGWRKGEIASLRWEDIEGGMVHLRGVNAKNGEARSVALVGELADLIERRRQARAVKDQSGILVASPLIFHREGLPVCEFRKAWASACKKAGVSGRLFHDLRRTAVRNFVRSGVPQSVAMRISGHKTFAMFKRYDITSENDLRDAMQRVERARAL